MASIEDDNNTVEKIKENTQVIVRRSSNPEDIGTSTSS